jgi:hypothetical protein
MKASAMECMECGQRFDLVNSYWPKPEANSRWLHTSGTGHENYLVHYDDGKSKRKHQSAPSRTLEGTKLIMKDRISSINAN